jgi:hypothetical protein
MAAVGPEALLRYRACGGGLDQLGDVRGSGGRGMRRGTEVRLGRGDREELDAVIGSANRPQKQRDANL